MPQHAKADQGALEKDAKAGRPHLRVRSQSKLLEIWSIDFAIKLSVEVYPVRPSSEFILPNIAELADAQPNCPIVYSLARRSPTGEGGSNCSTISLMSLAV